jgi:hypothetical protein
LGCLFFVTSCFTLQVYYSVTTNLWTSSRCLFLPYHSYFPTPLQTRGGGQAQVTPMNRSRIGRKQTGRHGTCAAGARRQRTAHPTPACGRPGSRQRRSVIGARRSARGGDVGSSSQSQLYVRARVRVGSARQPRGTAGAGARHFFAARGGAAGQRRQGRSRWGGKRGSLPLVGGDQKAQAGKSQIIRRGSFPGEWTRRSAEHVSAKGLGE